MRFDFSQFPLSDRAFSRKPMTFCEPQSLRFLSAILELAAIETGDRRARETWQASQLYNLFAHAAERSPFWRARLGEGKSSDALDLSGLPALSRRELREQVKAEGALLNAKDRIGVHPHSTSGSSGAPAPFFVSEMNSNYNAIRSTAQYFIEGRDLTLPRTALNYDRTRGKQGFSVARTPTWLGTLGPFVRSAVNKEIKLLRPDVEALWQELSADPIGYLSIPPRLLEWLLQHVSPAELKQAGAAMLILVSEPLDAKTRERCAAVGIAARATYSCEEVGPIAVECERFPGRYHVATSNVIVEVASEGEVTIGDARVGEVLLTHLHSYATPFIRYGVGDLASLADRCPCGHDGPTLANVVGRSKGLLKHADGRLTPFHAPGGEMMAIAAFDDYRIRQTAPATLVVEIGGRGALTSAESAAFAALVKAQAGDGFEIVVKAMKQIDWGENAKRLGFHNELL